MSTTYDQLVLDCVAAAEDDSDEFVAYIPVGLRLAQLRLFRDLDTYGYVTYASTSMTAGSPFVTKPTGTFIVKSFTFFTSDGSQTDLLQRTDEFCRDYWPIRTSVGVPKYYAPWGYNQVYIAPTPDHPYGNEWSLVVLPSAISSAAQTNWFTDFADEALFYGLMVEMMNFAKNPTMKAVWDERYQDAKSLLRNEARRTRRDDQTPNGSPAGADDNFAAAPPEAVNN
jgi:hypothetical protein